MCVPISEQPGYSYLAQFVERVLREKGEEIEFIVLYGSRAKGNWKPHSDFDLLIGLRIDDGKDFLSRLEDYWRLREKLVEPFVYSRSELAQMFAQFHGTLLEALDHGVVLFDRGQWACFQRQFQQWKEQGTVERVAVGWRISRLKRGRY